MTSYVRRENVLAIFIHGGAGSHSRECEGLHLKGLAKAAELAMAFLKAGATAVEAVEVAIMVLEDDHIFNAGVGSNLNMQGKVECDASVVDHFGRSGACGATGNVKNPIMLARKIYEESFIDPGSCRINPVLLVGKGAEDFAWDHGVSVVTDSFMITSVARARFRYWEREWKKYIEENPPDESRLPDPFHRRPPTPLQRRLERLIEAQKGQLKPTNGINGGSSLDPMHTSRNGEVNGIASGPTLIASGHTLIVSASTLGSMDTSTDGEVRPVNGITDGSAPNSMGTTGVRTQPVDGQHPNVRFEDDRDNKNSAKAENASQSPKPQATAAPKKTFAGQDGITDTVGAIAVDMFGNIAAGSSSGGIGLKSPGRVGPAALVGVGTHVIPVDTTDPEQPCAAAVTSGTGEQLTTTLAAQTCAQRVYFSQKMGPAGTFDQVNEEEALEAAVRNEFLRHPSAVNNEVSGCIGVMTVKKTTDGVGFYFAHTTETMALCSMSGDDKEPRALCSRNPNYKTTVAVASGGLMYRGKIIQHNGPLGTLGPAAWGVN